MLTFSYLFSHLLFSSSDRRLFERSMYPLSYFMGHFWQISDGNLMVLFPEISRNESDPFSLSTRTTTAHSSRPTPTSLLMDLIRLRDSSDRRIMPTIIFDHKRQHSLFFFHLEDHLLSYKGLFYRIILYLLKILANIRMHEASCSSMRKRKRIKRIIINK